MKKKTVTINKLSDLNKCKECKKDMLQKRDGKFVCLFCVAKKLEEKFKEKR